MKASVSTRCSRCTNVKMCSLFDSLSRLWLCTFSLSVSVGAVLLLPIAILSNEVLLTFPQSYYVQWLNGSLIHGTPRYTQSVSPTHTFSHVPSHSSKQVGPTHTQNLLFSL